MSSTLTSLHIGQLIEGQVIGIQSYGVFVSLNQKTQGLIHISEISDTFVPNIFDIFQKGDKLLVRIIDIDEYTEKISLSIRAVKGKKRVKSPYRIRKPRRHYTNRSGFSPIEECLPHWISNALEDIEKGKIKDYRLEEK